MKFSACAESEMKEIPSRPQAFHMALAIFHARRAFHKSRKGFISLKRNRLCLVDKSGFFSGAGNRTRTGTLFTARDFKSLVSTDFTMPANMLCHDNTLVRSRQDYS